MTWRGRKEKGKKKNEKREKKKKNQRAHINKAFEKINHFDGCNPSKCLQWLAKIHSMTTNYNRDYCEELLLISGGCVTKTIHGIDISATPEQIKDTILCNLSNQKTPSERLHAHTSIQQKPDKALQTYNSRYDSQF